MFFYFFNTLTGFQGHEELWMDAATKLTEVMGQVIEFAKMIPGFRKLPQDDQIALLKSGEKLKIFKQNFL